ncbi:MAG TPA: class I SAM-dependent methyltransferase [Tepidiformaceae bacterium]
MDEERAAAETREWLTPYLLRFRQAGSRVLDIGCGHGFESALLCDDGFRVTAFDRDAPSIRAAHERAPGALHFGADLSRPLPLATSVFDGAVASLSLHYLRHAETRAAVSEVHRVLRDGGLFLFRVNATDDFKFGAGDGEEVEPGVYLQKTAAGATRLKRFFDEHAVRDTLAGLFVIEELSHRTTYRWGPAKQTWQCLARAA